MGAVTLWVRSVLRRQRGATVFLVALLGLPSGIVFAAFEANHRAAGSLDRVIERSESWDVSMEMCPADIEVTGEEDAPTLRRICYSPAIGERLLSFLKTVPEVERAAVADPFQHAFLDPRSPNGWGWHMNGTYAFRTPGVPLSLDGAMLRSGRWPNDDAPHEITIDESTERALGLRIGDTVRIAGWDPASIDSAQGTRPNTVPFASTVVGVARTLNDVVQTEAISPLQGREFVAGRFFAGAGWAAANLDSLGRWSTSAIVKLRHGEADMPALRRALDRAGWRGGVSTPYSDQRPIVRSVISDERTATAAFAWLGLLATALLGVVFVRRQLRLELVQRSTLGALGFDRRRVVAATMLRALTISGPAALVAVSFGTLASTLTPFGKAGRIDTHGLRFAPLLSAQSILGMTMLGVIASFAAAHRPRRGVGPVRHRPPSTGPASLVGASLTRGGGPSVAAVASGFAVAALLGGSMAVASFDRARSDPRMYGAWSDATVDLWSTIGKPAKQDAMVGKAEGLFGVRSSTLMHGTYGSGSIGDTSMTVISLEHRRGNRPRLPLRAGRMVAAPDEMVLDLRAARSSGAGIGDRVRLTVDAKPYLLRVVGISYPFPDGCDCGGAESIAVVHTDVTAKVSLVSDVLVLGFDDAVTRARIIDTMRAAFGTYASVPVPPISLTHVGAVRTVPRLLATLVGALAFATLLHALVTLLRTHRRDFAVLSVLGFQRRDHRATRIWAALLLTLGGTAVGIPLGIVVGRRLWRVYTDRLLLLPDTRIPLSAMVAAPVLAVAVGIAVGLLAGRTSSARIPLAATLRTE